MVLKRSFSVDWGDSISTRQICALLSVSCQEWVTLKVIKAVGHFLFCDSDNTCFYSTSEFTQKISCTLFLLSLSTILYVLFSPCCSWCKGSSESLGDLFNGGHIALNRQNQDSNEAIFDAKIEALNPELQSRGTADQTVHWSFLVSDPLWTYPFLFMCLCLALSIA